MHFRDVTIQTCSHTLLRGTPFPNKNPRCLSQKLTNGTRMTMVETNKNIAISFAPRENPATGRTRTTTARRRAMKRKCHTYITILVRPSQTRKLVSSRSRASRHTHNIPIVAVKKNRGQEPNDPSYIAIGALIWERANRIGTRRTAAALMLELGK